jgi:hypothetical protein
MNAITGTNRLLILRMDPAQSLELFKVGGSILAGGLGLKLWDSITSRWRKKRLEPVELTAKIIDDGDRFREMLLEEVKSLRAEKDAAIEKCHKAELGCAQTAYENTTLRSRLTRKDEQCKALQSQLISLHVVPVILTGVDGRGEGSV